METGNMNVNGARIYRALSFLLTACFLFLSVPSDAQERPSGQVPSGQSLLESRQERLEELARRLQSRQRQETTGRTATVAAPQENPGDEAGRNVPAPSGFGPQSATGQISPGFQPGQASAEMSVPGGKDVPPPSGFRSPGMADQVPPVFQSGQASAGMPVPGEKDVPLPAGFGPQKTTEQKTPLVQRPDATPKAEATQPLKRGVDKVSSSPSDRPQRVTMNFKNVELQSLVKLMSDITGKNFIVDPSLKGQMTIVSPNEISVDEAYRVFLSVLEVHGFTVLESGGVVKVIQAMDAKSKGIETLGQGGVKSEDRMATQLISLKYGDAVDLAKSLSPLVPKTGLLVPYPETNKLIVIDTISNMERILRIVNELDVEVSRDEIEIFPLESANAEKLSSKLTNLFQRREGAAAGTAMGAGGVIQTGARGARETLRIVADDRTNSLIVMASAQTMSGIRDMIEKLDQRQVKRRGVHIYSLQYAVAEDVAKVLGQLSGKGGSTDMTKDTKAQAPVISKDVQISPDKATNTLVIIAGPEEYETIVEIVKELDVARTMVYVEALIVEVSATKSLDLGVEWRAADSFNGGFREGGSGGVALGGSPGASAVDALGQGVVPNGFTVGVVGKAINLGGVVFPSFGAFVKAVRTDSDFNVLSTPQILTLDNAEALIEVGQNIPFVTRVDQPNQTTERAIQTFEYRDIGVTLRVTPQINKNRTVRLGIEQSVKAILEKTALGGTVLAPSTTFRRAKTAITIKDGETAVIGGLIENRLDRGKTETPCLGGVPFLGWFFKSISDRDEKTNLLVFLSPHIVENPEESRKLYEEKKKITDKEVGKAAEQVRDELLRRKALQ